MRPVTPAEATRHWALHIPHKPAVIAGSRTLTFAELDDRMARLAGAAVSELGLAPGDRVVLFTPNSVEFVEIHNGLPQVGVAVAAVTPAATAADLRAICDDCEPRVVIVHASLEETARAAGRFERIVVLGPEYEALLAAAQPHRPRLLEDEVELGWLQYTSGTTGRPKGVMVSQHCKSYHHLANALEYGFRTSDHHLVVGSLAHGVASGKAMCHSYIGATLTLAGIFHPERIVRTLATKQITTTMMVPSHMKAILELGPETLGQYDLSALRTIVVGGAPFAQATKELAIDTFGEGILFEDYGSTELGLIAMQNPSDHRRKLQSVGRPALGVEVTLRDEDGAPVPHGEVGELYIHSAVMFLGYWRRPEETAAALYDGYYRTGDVARLDEDGYIYLMDRLNDRIITGGYTVYAREIEELLSRHPAVAEVVAFGVPDDQLGEAPRVAVALRDGHELGPNELEAFCAAELAQYKRPKWIDVLDALPKNATGKIQRRVLRDPYWVGQARGIS